MRPCHASESYVSDRLNWFAVSRPNEALPPNSPAGFDLSADLGVISGSVVGGTASLTAGIAGDLTQGGSSQLGQELRLSQLQGATLGFDKREFLEQEIRRVMGMFRDGGMLFCTSHFVQDHCTMDELTFAFDLVKDLRG